MDNFEVLTTTDKVQRDRMFEDLRRNGDPNERKVVKFSGNQVSISEAGEFSYVSNWSVAYPKKLNEQYRRSIRIYRKMAHHII